jgi:large subunit ribosomal protein L15
VRQDSLSPAPGSKKDRKRVGRGDGSGHGSYSGRGCKGQKSRAGHTMTRGFEGGQLPLKLRLPRKRGFFNRFRTEYSIVNLNELNVFDTGSEVTAGALVNAGILKSAVRPLKVLAEGNVDRPLTIKANKFTAAAKTKIEAAGGKAEEVGYEAETD